MYHINKHIHMHTHMEEHWDTIYMNFRKIPLDVMDKTDGHWQQLNLGNSEELGPNGYARWININEGVFWNS